MMPLSMRPVSGISQFAFYKLSHFFVLSRCSRSEGTPERVFLHFFRKRFRTRACTDFLGKRTQERFFLQRQKSECKISYRVRGMGPPQGPAFACTVTTINKTKQKKLKKTQVLLQSWNYQTCCVFTARANVFDSSKIIRKLAFFFSFFCFVLLIVVTVHAKAGP